MSHIKGIGASAGIAVAKAFVMETPSFDIPSHKIEDVAAEKARFQDAIAQSKTELEAIREHTLRELGPDKAEIFSAHLLIVEDPEIVSQVNDKIESENMNAAKALDEVAQTMVMIFESMDNEYMRERAADVRDVTKRVMAHILGVTFVTPASISEEVIIIAEDLTPSDTAQLNRKYVKGFATNIGGRTSHSAIMSRSLEIPAVVGTKVALEEIKNGDLVIIDGTEGDVFVNPSEDLVKEYEGKRADFEAYKEELKQLVNEESITADGHKVKLAANIGTPNDLEGVLKNGSDAIGLYRTEFLYMDSETFPTEEEQYTAYKTVLEGMEGKQVVIRTLDIGGDKELSYLDLPKEMNPFLGYRAIRLCLEETDLFRTQLRALLRASAHGNLAIMFPMIATLEEFRAAKALLLEEEAKLKEEGIEVGQYETGMMVEIPSTAVMAKQFAKEVDFFSVGTNDLIQYTMAADRMNEKVSYLYQPFNPAILNLLHNVITEAHKAGKWVGMCGEMAGEELAIPILLGLGLDEFSMSASSVLRARSLVKRLTKSETEAIVNEVLNMDTAEEVVNFLSEKFDIKK
ncbi:phosphoenolpyruvate--protein phosphotransferase [Exiguobacterium profundum]|jgi:phosphotransferase system enzyme I (PtsI)|uniref:phosphoenolpyruvate--protein phosphotransferase n=1 Tax=Exiguobacterium TaxID=33986 RepID=UPI00064A3931|nr:MULTISPECIES: phosphoenolpyruvate--protein phosphotransferase [Exiguobacterium]MCC9622355.1 phosphoenolpyruvate--protein phosphotransferase [Thalassospira sp. MA62]MDX5979983.1 phosphoenolpyruvate--protein phosphotransferase [Exiguobacterium profundum]QUP88068.1 phosphoenolpyruvate--protein phosphotransferase [Exiguobacterium sp. PFWT01]